MASPELLPETRREQSKLAQEVLHCLGLLAEACRTLVSASAEGMTSEQIADLVGIPRQNIWAVTRQLRECRQKLRALLAEGGVDWAVTG